MLGPHAPKSKACTVCHKPFLPARPLQSVCSPRCAGRLGNLKKAQEKAETRARKEAIQTIPELIRLADRAFMDYIRARDKAAGHPCISSGRPLDWSGNKVDAGHYRSRGAASHLRYHEDNCHAQTKEENRFKAGNVVDYRINLIARIGLAAVEALEASNEPHKWTHEELRQIAATYRQKRKELEG
jgi:hypothetical protein